ncbi:CYTH domain-containing protein [Mucilaginibacter sp. UR6-11]|uniref:CYTH domain-containing protein n=1 Tax=Mucilaginibacter sp. UR6-11 TaxID=1435644 RepID=UPI001E355F60|nr:CYTH domain-containing protein [Mucilaginibacter sp. UR6-11]MCC8427057.1 CYTH domain-containing protein [Mucilaginibacter sp. UR6-11]
MGIEIERKFLVDHDKWQLLPKPQGCIMRQGYIVNEPDRTIRLRLAGDKAYLTFKSGTSGISRREYEYEIPVNEAAELFEQFVKAGLQKTRYCITYMDKLWEVDVFEGDNYGLIIAEIELKREDEPFELPEWVTTEVSEDARYYNANLSLKPYNTW